MPTRGVGVPDNTNAAGVVDADVVERAALDIVTTTTADPGTSGTSLSVTARDKFPQSGQFKIRVENEIMYVTGGWGTGAGSFTVTRAQDGTAGVAHASGVGVYQLVGVQRVEPVDGSRQISYVGRIMSYRIPGRAGVAGQKLMSIYNASGTIKARVDKVLIDIETTVIKAVTVPGPVIRLWKVTVAPTNGTASIKVPRDSLLTSDANITVLQDASGDDAGSTTALTATLPSGTFYAQEFGPRLITAVGYEMFDKTKFLEDQDEFITLNQNEGLVIFLDYGAATQNPTTDRWVVGIEWSEYRDA